MTTSQKECPCVFVVMAMSRLTCVTVGWKGLGVPWPGIRNTRRHVLDTQNMVHGCRALLGVGFDAYLNVFQTVCSLGPVVGTRLLFGVLNSVLCFCCATAWQCSITMSWLHVLNDLCVLLPHSNTVRPCVVLLRIFKAGPCERTCTPHERSCCLLAACMMQLTCTLHQCVCVCVCQAKCWFMRCSIMWLQDSS
jgi:hypothetical protein